ncbi:hypothetical protein D3C80_1403260 [compost metagenome]
MVNFFDLCFVFRMGRHQSRKLLVDIEQNVHANTEIGSMKQGTVLFGNNPGNTLQFTLPCSSSNYNRNLLFNTGFNVLNHQSRLCEFDCNICSRQINLINRVFRINFVNNRMSSFQSNSLDCFSHLSVSD